MCGRTQGIKHNPLPPSTEEERCWLNGFREFLGRFWVIPLPLIFWSRWQLLVQESSCGARGGHTILWLKRGKPENECGVTSTNSLSPKSQHLGKVQYYFRARNNEVRAIIYFLHSGLWSQPWQAISPAPYLTTSWVCKYQWLEMFNCLKHYWFVGCSKISP